MRLWVYAVRRLLLTIPVVIGIMTVLFVALSILPQGALACAYGSPRGGVSPCSQYIPCPNNPGQICSNPVYQQAIQSLGLNQPVVIQWSIFMWHLGTFQWGYVSPYSALGTGTTGTGLPAFGGQPVTSVLAAFLPYSIELVLLTLLFTMLVVVPIQRRATAHPGRVSDRTAFALSVPGFGVPLLILGPLALMAATLAAGGPDAPSGICAGKSTVFLDFFGSWPVPPCTPLYGSKNLGPVGFPNWLLGGFHSTPTGFPTVDALLHGEVWLAGDTVARMIVPALVLAFLAVSVVLRTVRYTPVQREERTYLRAARASGLPESEVTGRLAGQSSLATITSAIAPAVAMTLCMLPVVEIIFNLYGVGVLFYLAQYGSHYPGQVSFDPAMLFGIVAACALIVLAVSVATDILRAYLDPRIR